MPIFNFRETDLEPVGWDPNTYRLRQGSVDYDQLNHQPLWWHKLGMQQTTSGYGKKITSAYMIRFEGRDYRLYHTIFSNSGTVWFKSKGRTIIVS